MLLENIIIWVRQRLRRRKFRKRYDPKKQKYVYRCVKCGKVQVIKYISELSVKQHTNTRNIPGVIFILKIGQMIRPKTVSYLVDGYTPKTTYWMAEKGEI